MINDDNKLLKTRKTGYKRIIPKEDKKKEKKPEYFNPDEKENWLFDNKKK